MRTSTKLSESSGSDTGRSPRIAFHDAAPGLSSVYCARRNGEAAIVARFMAVASAGAAIAF